MKTIKYLLLVSSVALLLSCATQQPKIVDNPEETPTTQKWTPVTAAKTNFPLAKKVQPSPDQQQNAPKQPPDTAQEDMSQQDIWWLIGDNLGFAQDVSDDQVQTQLKRFANNQEYFDRTLKRAELYLPYVLERVLDNDMPAEIALLPFIESAYNPFAYSHSGAAGLWQIIPSTGDHLNLKSNDWYDGRRDVVSSTGAALDYLDSLNQKFDGDWLLTLAAYNAGPGTVQRAINGNAEKGEAGDYWSLELRRETTKYVPRLIALTKVIADPGKYGIELEPMTGETNLAVVNLQNPIDLNQAAVLADISTDDIYKLNPGYKRWVTPPKGPFRLVLPGESVPVFSDNLETLPSVEWQPLQTYTVARGDTLVKIARTSALSVSELAELNKIKPDKMLQVGQVLRVPKGRGTITQESAAATYKVKAGDSLWTIAKANNVSVNDLRAWNNLPKDSTLRPGQALKLQTGLNN